MQQHVNRTPTQPWKGDAAAQASEMLIWIKYSSVSNQDNHGSLGTDRTITEPRKTLVLVLTLKIFIHIAGIPGLDRHPGRLGEEDVRKHRKCGSELTKYMLKIMTVV